jgi:DNA-binding transcriptional MerR regulator
MLSREQIFETLKDEYQLEITNRTFDYYRGKGIIPHFQGHRHFHGHKQRRALYPDNTPELIAKTKSYQKDGMSLSDIKKLLDAFEARRKLKQEIKEIKGKKEYLSKLDNPEFRLNRLISFLGLKDEGQKYNVGMIGAMDKIPETYLAVFYEKHIDFYRIQVDYMRTDNWKILDKKSFTPDGYEWIMRSLVKESIENGKILDKDDIFLNIFFRFK